MIVGMNHFTAIAANPEETLNFYVGLLGLNVGPRPDIGFDGAWLYAGGPHAVLHLYFDRPVPEHRSGVIDHMAFSARDLKAVKARFDAQGVRYDLRRQAGAGTWQLFCTTRMARKLNWTLTPPRRFERQRRHTAGADGTVAVGGLTNPSRLKPATFGKQKSQQALTC